MLTKSDLLSFRQCPRKLWLEQHRAELAAPDGSAAIRRRQDGNAVGERAREQLGPEVLWPRIDADRSQRAAIALQIIATAAGRPIVELPLAASGLFVRLDALVPAGDTWIIRETKASICPLKSDGATPGTPEDHYLDDVALQLWVAEQVGLQISGVELNLLDGRWRYPGASDYRGLFRPLDVTSQARVRANEAGSWLQAAQAAAEGEMPVAAPGSQCSQPHPCPFKGYCDSIVDDCVVDPIELLPGSAGKALARRLRATRGYRSILDPTPDELTGKSSALFRRIQNAHRYRVAQLVPEARDPLDRLPYPRYYFDFEGIDLAVPIWAGVRPYEQIPFQWSCHIERSPGQFEHAAFLDLSGKDPSIACIERMRETIDPDDDGPILVYSATYERGRLIDLAARHPTYADLVTNYLNRIVDLHPLVRDHYYHPDMRGSFSIKKVLATIAPELTYDDLDEVQEGTGAQVAYVEAALDPHAAVTRKADIAAKLLTYCQRDTWAMVEVAHFLAQAGRPTPPTGT